MSPTQDATTVVIPCYNGADFIEAAIASALSQTQMPQEVIVIDDGSTDGSADIVKGIESDRVRLIQQPNQGESVARNRGIEEASTEWIAFLDADDEWKPTKLEKQSKHFHQESVGVQTNFYLFGDREQVVDWSTTESSIRYSLPHIIRNRCFHVSALVFRKSTGIRFPTWTKYGEDLLFHLELAKKGRLELSDEVLTGYRFHNRNQTSRSDIEVCWDKSIKEWLSRNRSVLETEEFEACHRECESRLVEKARLAYWGRNWPTYWSIRDYLSDEEFSGTEAQAIVSQRIYPPLLYQIRDLFSKR